MRRILDRDDLPDDSAASDDPFGLGADLPVCSLDAGREAIAARGDCGPDGLLHFLRHSMMGLCADWPEAFALGIENAKFHAAAQARNPYFTKEIIEPEKKKRTYFFGRCGQIYKEEMREAERLATEARDRVAKRIEEEFPNAADASELSQALRENDLQGWAVSLDWN